MSESERLLTETDNGNLEFSSLSGKNGIYDVSSNYTQTYSIYLLLFNLQLRLLYLSVYSELFWY